MPGFHTSSTTGSPFSPPWSDHWWVGPVAETVKMVNRGKPWFKDDQDYIHDLLVLNAFAVDIGDGLGLAWVQALDYIAPMDAWRHAFVDMCERARLFM